MTQLTSRRPSTPRMLLIGGFILALILVLLSACGQQKPTDTGGHEASAQGAQLTVGSILVLSGQNAHYGEDTKAGMEVALEEVNSNGITHVSADGTTQNFTLNVQFENSHGGPDNTINAPDKMQELIDNGAPAILGGFYSSITLSLAPIANDRKAVLLTPCSTNYKLREAGPWVFRILPTDYDQAVRMADYALSTLGVKKAGVLNIDNDYGTDLADTFIEHFNAAGGEVVFHKTFQEGTREFGGFIDQLFASGAETLFLSGHTQEMGDIVRTKHDGEQRRGITPLPLLGTDGMYDDTFLQAAGPGSEGTVLASAGFNPQSGDPTIQRFVTKFRERFNKDPNLWSAGGYDSVLVLAEAIRQGGSTAEGIRQALTQIHDLPGATGINTVDETGGMTGKSVFTFIVKDGEFQTLDLATAEK